MPLDRPDAIRREAQGPDRLLVEHVRACQATLAKEKHEQESARSNVRVWAEAHTAPLLTVSKSLRDVGHWKSLPSPLPNCHTCHLVFNAMDLCNDKDKVVSVEPLARKWVQRHAAVPQPAKTRVRGLQESKCYRESFCHCSRTRDLNGYRAGLFWQKARRALQQVFADKADQGYLVGAEIILVWCRRSSAGVLQECVPTFVALQYLRPWRPTLALLETASRSETTRLFDVLAARKEPRPFSITGESSEMIEFLVKHSGDEKPVLQTALTFAASLDKSKHWSVAVMKLAMRSVPFLDSQGKVRAFVVRAAQEVWLGSSEVEVLPHEQVPGTDRSKSESSSDSDGHEDRPTTASAAVAERSMDYDEDIHQLLRVERAVPASESESSSSSGSTSDSDSSQAQRNAGQKRLSTEKASSSPGSSKLEKKEAAKGRGEGLNRCRSAD